MICVYYVRLITNEPGQLLTPCCNVCTRRADHGGTLCYRTTTLRRYNVRGYASNTGTAIRDCSSSANNMLETLRSRCVRPHNVDKCYPSVSLSEVWKIYECMCRYLLPGISHVFFIDCSALHRASNFNFSAFVFVLMVEAQQQVCLLYTSPSPRD